MANKQLLVERLVQQMDLGRIFLFSYSFLSKEQQHLILVMNPADRRGLQSPFLRTYDMIMLEKLWG
ncbi:hypothetical protein [Sphingobacterium haloxyli]|uniref:Uncharacterized protein n=1 Tax=Sphingobacterium haloxyli TaxID=2100533 RepID=A0A2S9J8Q1_9SPHI|nr:hypothetical protein [Sphingobacterium haloxyli]PRD49144.1 hypothetical protein C5745_00420 [Sphingobacterium haloxyli]